MLLCFIINRYLLLDTISKLFILNLSVALLYQNCLSNTAFSVRKQYQVGSGTEAQLTNSLNSKAYSFPCKEMNSCYWCQSMRIHFQLQFPLKTCLDCLTKMSVWSGLALDVVTLLPLTETGVLSARPSQNRD